MADPSTPEEIKRLREALDLTQEGLARELGVSFSTVSRWETGRGRPSPLARQRLAELQLQAKRLQEREETSS